MNGTQIWKYKSFDLTYIVIYGTGTLSLLILWSGAEKALIYWQVTFEKMTAHAGACFLEDKYFFFSTLSLGTSVDQSFIRCEHSVCFLHMRKG